MTKTYGEGGQRSLQAITILDPYDDDGVLRVDRLSGFLTGVNHAMYVEPNYGVLSFVGVEPTDDASVYATNTPFSEFGIVEDPANIHTTIEALTKTLNSMTGFDFLTKVILNLRQEIDFEDKILPIPVRTRRRQKEDNREEENTIHADQYFGDISNLPEELQQRYNAFLERIRARKDALEKEGTAV